MYKEVIYMAIDRSLVSGSMGMMILRLLTEKDMYGYETVSYTHLMGILSVGTDTFYYGMGRLAGTNDTDPGAGTGVVVADVEAAGKSARCV